MKRNIKDLDILEIENFIKMIGEKKFRTDQIFKWIYSDISDFEEMSDLPKTLRLKLADEFDIKKAEIQRKQVSRVDGTIKYLLKLSDEVLIETVSMQYKHGHSVCISTQAGCRMGCTFCASGLNGLERNLTPGEMIEQIMLVQRDTGVRVDSLVLMGTGEPFDNYSNVMKFLRNLIHPIGLNIGQRHITISTAGIVPGILNLSNEGLQINLAISLHNPFNEERSEIMPINKKYPIDMLIATCKNYYAVTKRRVTFEYALIMDLNDSERHAAELVKLLSGFDCHINLIPVNEVIESGMHKSKADVVNKFFNYLKGKGLNVTIRRELGNDIDSACGQLRLRHKVE